MNILFPFEHVPHGSRIVIYGAGMVGQIYLRQVQRTYYGEVVCISDKNYQRYREIDGISVCAPNDIKSFKFDVIVVAMMSPVIRKEAGMWLSKEIGLNSSAIITVMGEPVPRQIVSIADSPVDEDNLAFSCYPDKIASAIYFRGGLGDCIVMKRYLIDYLSWDKDIIVDVYIAPTQYDFLRVLLSDVHRVHRIISAPIQYNQMKKRYRVALAFHFDCDLDYWDEHWMIENKSNIVKRFRYFDDIKHFVGNVYGIEFLVHRLRCEMEGRNFFNAYNRYGFNVQSNYTTIPLLPEYKRQYHEMELSEGKYIVLNYGWGRDGGFGKPMAKVWPWRHYLSLIRLLKDKLTGIELIQIGLKNTPQMPGVDRCFLGCEIELIKYILKGAAIHIDCEGGMVHLATQLGTKCIVIFGPTKMSYYAYQENINLKAGNCHDCYNYVSDGISCYKRMLEPACMAAVTPEMVAKAVMTFFRI